MDYDPAPFSALDDFMLYDSANLNDFLGNEAFSHHYAIYGQNQIKICRAAKRAD